MRRTDAVLLALLLVVGLAAAVTAARVADHYERGGALRAELSRRPVGELRPATRARLEALEDELVLTYYVSERAAMPSSMKRVERDVVDLLEAMRAAAPDRVAFHLVDPDAEPDKVGYASRRRVAPFRVRSVTRDAWSERLVWSTLVVSYGSRPEVSIDGITPEHVPRLQATILEHLERMERPTPPVLALAAPAEGAAFDELAALLAERGELRRVDLDGGEPFPDDADVLLWMRPAEVGPRRLDELERFLASGRSAVVAGSLWTLPPSGLVPTEGGPALRVERAPFAAEPLHSALGLSTVGALVLDARGEQLVLGPDEQLPAPFLVRSIAPNHDFRTWRSQPNGTLLFHLPSPIEPDGDVLAARGWQAEVLATTSDRTWLQAPPVDVPRPLAELGEGEPATKLPLVVALRPADPWQGTLVALAATTPFEDGVLRREGYAHRRLVEVLLAELASPERLVAAAAEIERPEPIPELGVAARLGWRALAIGLVPAALALFAIARGVHRRGAEARRRARGGGRVGLAAGAALVLALVAARGLAAVPARLDATDEGLNRLAPETVALARRAGELGRARARLVVSDRDRLPPPLRPLVPRLRARLAELDRAGAALEVERVDPDALDAEGRAELAALGVEPARVAARDGDVTTVRTFWCALVLERGGRREVLPFPDAASFQPLELRLAFALWRLETGERPRVAFASDAKRPSAAEAFERYQQKSLFAPKGTDPYSIARRVLERLDLEVVYVNPRDFLAEPEVPPDVEALVWMQPRRSIEAMLDETVRYLHGGGDVLLAAQHFNVQTRQYPGRQYRLSYWPQPQSPDVDLLYLPWIGVHLVREVLLDELFVEITVDTQIEGRPGGTQFERQTSAREFQVRASAANFAPHPVTRNLGDQAFVWASPIRLDRERLAEHGLEAEVLMSTSPRAWTHAWSGGFLEEGAPPLTGPPPGGDGAPAYAGRLPLAVLVEGVFPRPDRPLELRFGAGGPQPAGPEDAPAEEDAAEDPAEEGGAEDAPDGDAAPAPQAAGPAPEGTDDAEAEPEEPWPDPAPGRLLLVGSSEVFKDEHLLGPEFRGDHLLVNAVAFLALPPELAAVAARRPVARGFDYVEPAERLRWRALVLALPPAALAAVGLGFAVARLRRPRPPAPPRREEPQP